MISFLKFTSFVLFVALSISPYKLKAQDDVNRRLNNAINGFEFDEALAKNALAHGANINWRNDAMGGETLLISAIKGFKEANVVRFLIQNGADPNLKDNAGKTALDWAVQYRIGKDNKGREILKLLGQQQVNKQPRVVDLPEQKATQQANQSYKIKSKTVAGGPGINDIIQTLEKSLTKAYEDHFFGVKNKITFEWMGGIVVGNPERRLRQNILCYPVKLNVKVTMKDPRDGNTGTVSRGTDAEIGGYRKTEIFCFFKNGFGEWDYGTYEQ